MSLKQQHYRRLMKEQKSKTSGQKIDHPLAKYNALGQLTCVVCTAVVKNDLLWSTHLQSRKHKDNVVALKSKALNSSKPVKRELTNTDAKNVPDPSPKKPKTVTPDETSPALPPDFFDSGVSKEILKNDETTPTKPSEGIPPDFFDSKPKSDESKPKTEDKNNKLSDKEGPSSNSSALPEGFFDDPKRDAKARKVEYKDPELEEWEKFQKSIQKEDDVSDALIQERDMESKEDREEAEVQEQASCYLRAEKLRQRQEVLNKATPIPTAHTEQSTNEDSEGDDLDLDDLLDWRAKVS